MIFGNAATAAPPKAYFIILLGQSNADGRREPTRLQNTDFNYKGIAAGYPTVRSGQAQYVAAPSGVYIYRKTGVNTDDFSPDNGSWQAYEAGVTSSYDDNAFGSELACATRIKDTTGTDAYIIKVAFGGTGLSNTNTASTVPGNWNPTVRYMAAEFWIKRALRDFRTSNPTVRPELLCINWAQGEQDGVEGRTAAVYEAQFAALKTYMERIVGECFVVDNDRRYIWNIANLKFNENAAEAVINTALTNIVATYSDAYLCDITPYPQGDALTVAEAAPLAVGLPNADGGLDNNHISYIGQLSMGELQYENIVAAGLI
jgi:hypothetical protein